jgi:hypothetical protein
MMTVKEGHPFDDLCLDHNQVFPQLLRIDISVTNEPLHAGDVHTGIEEVRYTGPAEVVRRKGFDVFLCARFCRMAFGAPIEPRRFSGLGAVAVQDPRWRDCCLPTSGTTGQSPHWTMIARRQMIFSSQ